MEQFDPSEATMEVETTTGYVGQIFMTGTMDQVYLFARGLPAGSWSGNGSGNESQETDVSAIEVG